MKGGGQRKKIFDGAKSDGEEKTKKFAQVERKKEEKERGKKKGRTWSKREEVVGKG
jgi:hypothetical protein